MRISFVCSNVPHLSSQLSSPSSILCVILLFLFLFFHFCIYLLLSLHHPPYHFPLSLALTPACVSMSAGEFFLSILLPPLPTSLYPIFALLRVHVHKGVEEVFIPSIFSSTLHLATLNLSSELFSPSFSS